MLISANGKLVNQTDNPEYFSAKYIKSRKSSYLEKIVYNDTEIERLVDGGWKVLKVNPKSKKLGYPKRHDVEFNDRVWALFARLGFTYLNIDDRYKVPFNDKESRQIDVFAVDDEAIILVECKSSSKRKRVDHKLYIRELILQKEGLLKTAKQLFGRELKVAFIWATNNCVLGQTDRNRLRENHIFHFNQDDITYFEQISDHLGSAGKYQLFGKLFENQKIPNLKNRFPAIKGSFPNGISFFSFNIAPEYLLKIGYILHRSDTSAETSNAYQRIVRKSRLNKIRSYIRSGGFFANSVLINISLKNVRFDQASLPKHDTDTKVGVLHLPKVYRRAFIIDGQHRLYGYTDTDERFNSVIPVVALINADSESQERLFIDINHEQKSVPTNLLRSLMADFNYGSADVTKAIPALKARLLIGLNNSEESPFYQRIKVTEEEGSGTKCLTLQTLLTWGLNTKTNYFGRIKGVNLIDMGHLLEFDGEVINHDKSLLKAKSFFNGLFSIIEECATDQWAAGNDRDRGLAATNVGVSAIILVTNDILEHLRLTTGVNPRTLSAEDIIERIKPYVVAMGNYLYNLSQEDIATLRSRFGSGAPPKLQRILQSAIHSEHENFQPEGLLQWIRESDGHFTRLAWQVGFEELEPMIRSYILQILQMIHGKDNWWFECVPDNVRKESARLKEEKRSRKQVDSFLYMSSYHRIVEANWGDLGNTFTPPGLESAKKSSRISWMENMNSIRSKYSHPPDDPVSEQEYRFLLETRDWLQKRLN